MSLNVFFSNSLEQLADQCIGDRLSIDWTDPFHPPELIVPSVQTFQWLQARILERFGVTAVLNYRFLDAFLWEELSSALGAPQRESTPQGLLQLRLIRLLQQTSHPWLSASPTPQDSQSGQIPDRLIQMSETFSRLFLEYFSSREGLAEAWDNNRDFFTGPKDTNGKDDENFQRTLYRQLRAEDGIWTIAHEMGELRSKKFSPGNNGTPAIPAGAGRPVYLFNMTGLGLVYHDLLAFIAGYRDVYAWILNPCAAFWEDVDTVRERHSREKRLVRTFGALKTKDLALIDKDENPLLRSWGTYGKRLVKAWSERAADYANTEFTECPPLIPGKPDTLLSRIQDSILCRKQILDKPSAGSDASGESDNSLTLYACKGRLRQMEVLRDWVWEQIRTGDADEPLSLDQIGVYLPDPAAYASEISLVFDAWPQWHELHIPWCIDGKTSNASRSANALHAYLALMEGAFTRPQVLAFIGNPLVMEKLGLTESDLCTCRRWIGELNIFRGFDAAHRKTIDGRAEQAHTWQQGIDRLLLGAVAGGVTRMGDCEYLPYRDINTGDDNLVYRFVEAISRLWNNRIALIAALGSAPGWEAGADCLRKNLREWMAPADRTEAPAFNEFLNALLVVRGNSGILPSAASEPADAGALFLRWAKLLIPGETRSRSRQGGVLVFRALKPGNVFPSKICGLVGFGAAEFPGNTFKDSLDLRQYKPQHDDADSVIKNLHAFLEAVVGTRERLAVFYTALDPVSGQETAPASTVLELLSAAGLELGRFQINTPLLAEEGIQGAGAGNGTDTSAVVRNPFPVMDPMVRTMANRSPARAENASQPGESERVSRQDKRHQRIKLNALKSWLEDPFKYRLQQALGRDDTEESLEILGDEEPFETGFFTGLMLVRETWDAALREFAKAGAIDRNHLDAIIGLSDNDRKALYDRLFETGYKVRCLKGETPEGLFSGLDRQKLSDEVVNMLDRLWDAVGSIENIQAVELLQPGQPAADTGAPKAGLVFDAVPKEGESVVLEGRSMVGFRATAKNNTTVLHVFIAAYPKLKDDNKVKYALLPWLTAEAVASARASDFTLVIHLLGAERAFEFAIEITGDNATGHLRSLADDYVTNTKTSHLPLQAIESLTQRGRAVDDLTFEEIAQWLDDDADKGDSASYKSYDPLINLLEQPLCEDAEAAVKMRYSELVKACYPANPARGGA